MNDSVSPPPAANTEAARTPDGTLKDAAPPVTQTQTESNPSSTSTTPSQPNDTTTQPTSGAPDKYDFKPPQGTALDDTVIAAATPIFRELGLSQAAADKLVDFYNQQMKAVADTGAKAVLAMREKWVTEVRSDPEMGGKLESIKADVGRALDTLNDAKLIQDFKTAMDLTGAGDNPAFVKAFWKLSQRVIEGKPVTGGGPSPHGQVANGQTHRPTLAQAMYPSLARTDQ